MLNRKEFETEQFSTESMETVTVDSAMLENAANDAGQRVTVNRQPNRVRRQPLVTSSPVGGWKLRMW